MGFSGLMKQMLILRKRNMVNWTNENNQASGQGGT